MGKYKTRSFDGLCLAAKWTLSVSQRGLPFLPHAVNVSLSSLNSKIKRLSLKSLTKIALYLCLRRYRSIDHLWLGFRCHRITTIIDHLNPNIEQLSGKGLQHRLQKEEKHWSINKLVSLSYSRINGLEINLVLIFNLFIPSSCPFVTCFLKWLFNFRFSGLEFSFL